MHMCACCPSNDYCGIWCNHPEMLHVTLAAYQLPYFSILSWLFSPFHGFQSKHPPDEFVCTVRVWQRKLQHALFEAESTELWRQQCTAASLSKKERRKDRYNCMCVKDAG